MRWSIAHRGEVIGTVRLTITKQFFKYIALHAMVPAL